MNQSVDPTLCPLCGNSNECGSAAGKETCWCFDVTLDADALARIPEAAQNVACICRRCGLPLEPTN